MQTAPPRTGVMGAGWSARLQVLGGRATALSGRNVRRDAYGRAVGKRYNAAENP